LIVHLDFWILVTVTDVIPLSRVIGERLRRLRSESGVPMERIAAEARQLGLGWAKSSVSALEAGRHELGLGELLLLPIILARAQISAIEYIDFDGKQTATGDHPVDLADLIPNDDRRILLAGNTHTSARALHVLLSKLRARDIETQGAKPETGQVAARASRLLSPLWCQRFFEAIRDHKAASHGWMGWHPDEDETFWPTIWADAADDATRKAAAVLRAPPIAVALVAQALWHWSMTAEREHRLAGSLIFYVNPCAQFTDAMTVKRDWNLTEQQKQVLGDWRLRGNREAALPPTLRRKMQAMRGHFTRDLIRELRPLMKDVTSHKHRRKAGKSKRRGPPRKSGLR